MLNDPERPSLGSLTILKDHPYGSLRILKNPEDVQNTSKTLCKVNFSDLSRMEALGNCPGKKRYGTERDRWNLSKT